METGEETILVLNVFNGRPVPMALHRLESGAYALVTVPGVAASDAPPSDNDVFTDALPVTDDPTPILFGYTDFVFSVVLNDGQETIWLGGDDVTPEKGYPLRPGQPFTQDRLGRTQRAMFGVTASGKASTVRVLRY
jgi:hypothetical protein